MDLIDCYCYCEFLLRFCFVSCVMNWDLTLWWGGGGGGGNSVSCK